MSELNQQSIQAIQSWLDSIDDQEAKVLNVFVPRLVEAWHEGHTYIEVCAEEEKCLSALKVLVGERDAPFILSHHRLFIGRLWQMEWDLAREVVRLACQDIPMQLSEQLQNYLQTWFADAKSEGQKQAVINALHHQFTLISGGPGTGKTTTVAKLLALLCADGMSKNEQAALPRIALAAPTGKAAAHMGLSLHRAVNTFDVSERVKQHLLQLEGQTLHRLLQQRPPMMQAQFHRERPLPYDIIVVDEAGMLDLPMMLSLLQATADGSRLVLLGDANQLPSVGVGAVLSSLMRSHSLNQHIAFLTYSHRFHQDSGIGHLAQTIARGDAEQAWASFQHYAHDVKQQQGNAQQQAQALHQEHQAYWQAVEENDVVKVFQHQSDVMVLAARHEEAEALNRAYCQYVQTAKGERWAAHQWFAGQIIMIERNDYAQNLFNGDIGVVLWDKVNHEQPQLLAYFPDTTGYRGIALSMLPEHKTAFAITVHKSQGSEYQTVWYIAPEHGDSPLSNRPLLYTAVTRAKKQFVYWGNRNSFNHAIKQQESRRTALSQCIDECYQSEQF